MYLSVVVLSWKFHYNYILLCIMKFIAIISFVTCNHCDECMYIVIIIIIIIIKLKRCIV